MKERRRPRTRSTQEKALFFFLGVFLILKWKECEKLHFTDIGLLQFLGCRKTVVSDIEGKMETRPTLVTTDHALLDAAV
jgi:hypothetical protein